MRQIIHFTVLILLLNICFLFSPKPRPETNFYGEYVPINAYAGFIRNYDSNEFLESAVNPSALLRENYVRQSRPLYVIVASGIGYSIYYVSNFNAVHTINIEKSMYMAYVILNFIILLLALFLFNKIADILTGGKISYPVILILSVFIASNFMTKAFFWTAHQQMMAFLMPLLSIYISICIHKGVSVKRIYILFFMLGLGMLAYGSFLILFVIFVVQLCYAYYKKKTFFTLQTLAVIAVSCLLFFAPTVLWIKFLKYTGVEYYSHEVVRYRQIVWMIDAISISVTEFLTALYSNIIDFLKTTPKLYLFLILFIITLLMQKIKTGIAFQWNYNSKLLLLNLFCFGCFFILLGYYAARLTFTLMPLILCLSIANCSDMLNKRMQIVLLLIASVWHAMNVFSYGPFS